MEALKEFEAVLSPVDDSPLDLLLLLIYYSFKMFYELHQFVELLAHLILNYSIDSFTWISRKQLWCMHIQGLLPLVQILTSLI